MAGTVEVESDRIKQVIVATAESVGVPLLKEKQLEALVSFASVRDTFVSLPTGYGKSIIYGLLPNVFDKLKGE